MSIGDISKDQAVRIARGVVETEGRKWLVSGEVRCYENPKYSTQVHVLEGSPARGHVLDIENSGDGQVIAFGMCGRRLKTFHYSPDCNKQ